MHWLLSRFHVAIHHADASIYDSDVLCRRMRILFGTLTDLNPLNKQAQGVRESAHRWF